jgi:hypothetical protein
MEMEKHLNDNDTEEDDDYIYEINNDNPFIFNRLTLENPEPISNGFFLIKLSSGNNPLYVQMPKCNMKNGIISNKREKYTDLLYLHKDNIHLIEWIDQIESYCKDMIERKKKVWFQSDLNRDDLDTMMTPTYRLYKSGTNILIRTYIDIEKQSGKEKCLVYDESQNMIDLSRVDNDREIIPLLHFEGIRFSSKTFEIEVKMIQMMIMNKPNNDAVCMIKKIVPTDKSLETKSQKEPEKEPEIIKEEIKVSNDKPSNDKPSNDKPSNDKPSNDKPSNEPSLEEQVKEAKTMSVQQTETETETVKKGEDLNKSLEDVILEVSLDDLSNHSDDILELKKPNQVYYKIYKAAREKALKMRQSAIEAFLEAKQIKTKYMLHNLDDSDDSDVENDYPNLENDSEIES